MDVLLNGHMAFDKGQKAFEKVILPLGPEGRRGQMLLIKLDTLA